MKRVAALSASARHELFSAVAERRNMGSPAVVEKDFWVCWTLKHIFEHPDLSRLLIFKGGTSLSKVHGLIERFSEDIDLILDWNVVATVDPLAPRSKTQQDRVSHELDEAAKRYIAGTLTGLLKDSLGQVCRVVPGREDGMSEHIIDIHYPETMSSGYLRPWVTLEIGPLAAWVPHADYIIRPYAAEEFPNAFDQPECPVRAIEAKRTFWEKATILHHEARRPDTSLVPIRYSRHYYDLFQMARHAVKEEAFRDLSLLKDVVAFKNQFYPRGWARYDLARPGTFKLIPPPRVLDVMRKDYESMKEMMFGTIPEFHEIESGLGKLEAEINALTVKP